MPEGFPALKDELQQVTNALAEAQDELREISRGLHPAVLSKGGLGPALRTVARRSTVPIEMHVNTESRYPATVEVAVYYVVSEALTNSAKHAEASRAEVLVEEHDDKLLARVCDDGVGGADPRRGSGLTGLRDRIEALGGAIEVTSPAGVGTTIEVTLPI
jgi:signal transduction histidine kinase